MTDKPEQTMGDNISVGNVSSTGIAIGRNARAQVTQGDSAPAEIEQVFSELLKRTTACAGYVLHPPASARDTCRLSGARGALPLTKTAGCTGSTGKILNAKLREPFGRGIEKSVH